MFGAAASLRDLLRRILDVMIGQLSVEFRERCMDWRLGIRLHSIYILYKFTSQNSQPCLLAYH